jgi:DNA polymerase III subunit delta'
MLFREVIGQQEVKQHLVEMVKQNRLSHALIFLGKEGSGTLPLAMSFAQYVSLLPRENTLASAEPSLFGEPLELVLPSTPDQADAWMEQQPSFQKARGLVHPDIHFSYPVVTKKPGTAPVSSDYISEWREFIGQYPYGNVFDWLQFIGAENKQGNITAQECNEIIKKLSLKSYESGYKVLIMWMPEYLGKEGNKLLKLIEEPPPDTLFVLVAESEASILSTILSRCQLVKVPALSSEDIEKQLIEKSGCNAQTAKSVANASAGNYREALNLLQHADEDFASILKDWMNAVLKNQVIPLGKIIEELARLGREKQKQFLRYYTNLIEQAVRLEVSGDQGRKALMEAIPQAELDFITRLNKAVSLEQKQAVAAELDKASYYIERNANAKILFHALSIRMFYIIRNNVLMVA